MDRSILVSTIIATIGRTSLEYAATSVLQQEAGCALELIVVNDSATPLPQADWQLDERVRLLNTNGRERSIARNAGAAVARGRYLHFLDDDDYLLPGAWVAISQLARTHTGFSAYYGATKLIDRTGKPLFVIKPQFAGDVFIQAVAGEWFPLQSTWIRAGAFAGLRGFDPQAVGIEDIDLVRRLALHGRLAATTQPISAVSMGQEGSTTDAIQAQARGRLAREALLSRPETFSRLRQSASNPYWRGRLVRAYVTSFVWNTRRGYLLTAAARFARAGLSIAGAGRDLGSRAFWRAVSRPHDGIAFACASRSAQP